MMELFNLSLHSRKPVAGSGKAGPRPSGRCLSPRSRVDCPAEILAKNGERRNDHEAVERLMRPWTSAPLLAGPGFFRIESRPTIWKRPLAFLGAEQPAVLISNRLCPLQRCAGIFQMPVSNFVLVVNACADVLQRLIDQYGHQNTEFLG